MTQRTLNGVSELRDLIGKEIGTSDWQPVGQDTIDAFAETTGDAQWIHTDPERAAQGPYGTTIAHGFLVLSLIPLLANQVYAVQGFSARVNYGLEKVRFPQPLTSGDSIRDTVTIQDVTETRSGVRVTFGHRIESTQNERPVCVAETVILFTTS
jgi:acyl dehydratase